ncbi:MAG: glutamate--cysteine ligase [Rhodospirillales bacterium]
MSGASETKSEPITEKRALVEHLESGCKPPGQWRIGAEHEKFPFHREDLSPLEYEGGRGVRALLEKMTRFGWAPVMEGENIIALKNDTGGAISLEPAGQFELSGAPVETIHHVCAELSGHLQQTKAVAAEIGAGFLGLGYRPKGRREDMPWMPKGRYKIMREYMPKKGGLGLEMMQNTCTVQVNLDFCSESVMVEMFRVSLALQPVATALWANSPFREGAPNGYMSYRAHIWSDTDPDRSGAPAFVFEDGFGFERYAEYILDVPMYFVYRDGKYIDVSGKSFRDFMAGKLEGFEGEHPHMGDWENHLSTAFPDVRLKTFLEMRGADGGPSDHLCALPAFWTGLLYDADARAEALDLIKDWTAEERAALAEGAPKHGLKTPFRGGTMQDIAKTATAIAVRGLKSRARLDGRGVDEGHFLRPVTEIAESGVTQAERLLELYKTKWNGSVDPVFTECAY